MRVSFLTMLLAIWAAAPLICISAALLGLPKRTAIVGLIR